MKIISIVTQKGGVGKTASAYNLAIAAKDVLKLRTAVIDLDGQANLSVALTGDIDIKNRSEGGADELFINEKWPKPTATEHGIDLFHGHAGIDRIDNDDDCESRGFSAEMRARLRKLPYDVIIVDTPPAIGLRHMAPLYWAHKVVIPMDPDTAAMLGAQDTVKAVALAKKENKEVKWVAVLNKIKKASKSHQEAIAWARAEFGSALVAELGDRMAVPDSRGEEKAVWQYRGADRVLREQWLTFCKTVLN